MITMASNTLPISDYTTPRRCKRQKPVMGVVVMVVVNQRTHEDVVVVVVEDVALSLFQEGEVAKDTYDEIGNAAHQHRHVHHAAHS
jgi:hypothetical protein